MAAIGKQILGSLNTPQSLTIPAGTQSAKISCSGKNVRYWLDGSTPTTDDGHQLFVGSELQINRKDGLDDFLWLEESASAELAITYFDKELGE